MIFIILKILVNICEFELTNELKFHYIENMNRPEIISIIRERRKNLNITQTMLAELAGVSLHTVSDMESGKGNPSLDVLLRIADTLGLELTLTVRGIE